MHKPDIIVGVSKGTLRPEIPPSCPPDFAQLMRDCWEQDPEKRPLFSDILTRLKSMAPPPVSHISHMSPVTLSPRSMTEKFRNTTEVEFLHSWEIETSEMEFCEQVGQGASSHVFRGKYRGQEVAIKVLKEAVGGGHLEEFRKEFEVVRYGNNYYGPLFIAQLAIILCYPHPF